MGAIDEAPVIRVDALRAAVLRASPTGLAGMAVDGSRERKSVLLWAEVRSSDPPHGPPTGPRIQLAGELQLPPDPLPRPGAPGRTGAVDDPRRGRPAAPISIWTSTRSHFGDDVALESHYVPRRSQRTEAVLSLFVQDSETRNLLYANAACTKADQAGQVIAFARHWQAATGHPPSLLVFDSKVTTGAGLAELNAAGLRFITLRARTAKLTAALEALPDSQWTAITLDRHGAYNKPQVHEQDVTVRGCPVPLRQIAVRGLGHEHPTLILTNDRSPPRSPAA
jgi:hypothetical protein